MRIRYFNTYEPVVPLFQEILPEIEKEGNEIEIVIAKQKYRKENLSTPLKTKRISTIGPQKISGRAGKAIVGISYAVGAAQYALTGKKVDLNVFLTQPPVFNVIGQIVKKIRRQEYICHIMDLYPWIAIRAGVIAKEGTITKLLELSAIEAMKNAKRNIVIGRCMEKRLTDLGVYSDKIRIVENWCDVDTIRPQKGEEEKKKYGLEKKKVVMYSGNIGVSHRFEEIVEVAKMLRKRKDVKFVFRGDGVRRKEIERKVKEYGLENIKIMEYAKYERLGDSLSMGDVHFVSLREGYEGLVVPSKAYGIMAAGRPIIYQGNENGEIARMIKEEGIGKVINENDPERMKVIVEEALDDDLWRDKTGAEARLVAKNKYSKESMIKKYTKAIVE
jgi:putative colanic acid biosynthesis glycosyltransferase WcaI